MSSSIGLAGRFTLRVFKAHADGSVNRATGRKVAEFDNLITDDGLDSLGTTGLSQVLSRCAVGTGNTPPAVTDGALETEVARIGLSSFGIVGSAAQSAPYHGKYQPVYTFGVGEAEGNLAEIGIFNLDSGGVLWSRALILDGEGSPTTITVLADEILEVTYELRMYAPTVDQELIVTVGTVDHDVVVRASNVTDSDYWGTHSSPGFGTVDGICMRAWTNATLGAVTTTPAGSQLSPDTSNVTNAAYVEGNLYIDFTATMGLAFFNGANGISAVTYKTCWGSFQASFDPPIDKDDTKTGGLTFRVGPWSRYTP